MSSYVLLEGGTDRLLLESGDFLVLEDHSGSSPQTLTVPHIGPTGTLHAPTITSSITLTVPHIGPTGTLYEPTITVGTVTIVVPHIGPTGTLHAPTITAAGSGTGYDSGNYDDGTYDGDSTAPTVLTRTQVYREPETDIYREPRTDTYGESSTARYREGRNGMSKTYVYYTTSELPAIALEWQDRDGAVIDLSAATFRLVITPIEGGTATTKTSGITGAAVTPNIIIGWSAGELAAIGTGAYTMQLEAVVSGNARPWNPGSPDRLVIRENA